MSTERTISDRLRLPRLVVVSSLVGVVALCALAALFLSRRGAAPRLPNEAYVWQRNWSPAVCEAVRTHGPDLAGLVYLGAEIDPSTTPPSVVRPRANMEALQASGTRVGCALRVGPYPGPFDASAPVSQLVLSTARALVAKARSSGTPLREFQIDFDCATRNLAGYESWIRELRAALHPLPVVFTSLPSWLRAPAFQNLAAASDGYVLQVHSIEPPASIDRITPLCDPHAALDAITLADRINVPFRIALPTYGYRVHFNSAGKFIGGAAESGHVPAGTTATRELRSDPAALAALVRDIQDRKLSNVRGFIWYRLPSGDDILNWSWVTLQAIVHGETPTQGLRLTTTCPVPTLVELVLENTGTGEAPIPPVITVRWKKSRLSASDALPGFRTRNPGKSGIVFESTSAARSGALASGERRVVGWLRFEQEAQDLVAQFK